MWECVFPAPRTFLCFAPPADRDRRAPEFHPMAIKHLFAAAACAAALLTCGPASAADPVTYTVGTGATYRPFEFQAPNKDLVGFDLDLVKAIAKEQGFYVEFINTP